MRLAPPQVETRRKLAIALGAWTNSVLHHIFEAWRDLVQLNKLFSQRSRLSYLRTSFKRMHTGLAAVGGVLVHLKRLQGYDSDYTRRRAFRKWKSQASHLAFMIESKQRWATGARRGYLYHWNEQTNARLEALSKISFAISHSTSVLLKTFIVEWRLCVRHEIMARNHLKRISRGVAFRRMFLFGKMRAAGVSSAITSLHHRIERLEMQVLRGWHARATWKGRKRRMTTAALGLFFGKLITPIFAEWARVAHEAAVEAARMRFAADAWSQTSCVGALHNWVEWTATRKRYTAIGFTLASKNRAGLMASIMVGWRHLCNSQNEMRARLLNQMRLQRTSYWFAKFSLNVRQLREQRRLLRRMMSSRAESVLGAHLGAWRDLIKRKTARRSRVNEAVRLRGAGKQAQGFLAWLTYVEAVASQLAVLQGCVISWCKNAIGAGIRTWYEHVDKKLAMQSKLRSFFGRVAFQKEAAALTTWREFHAEQARKMLVAQRALWRIRNRVVAHAWIGWKSYVVTQQRHKAILRRSLARVMMRLQHSIFNAWRDFHAEKRRLLKSASSIGMKHEQVSKLSAVAQWVSRTREARERDDKLRKSLGFLKNQLLAMAFNMWQLLMQQAAEMRSRMVRRNRMSPHVTACHRMPPHATACDSSMALAPTPRPRSCNACGVRNVRGVSSSPLRRCRLPRRCS